MALALLLAAAALALPGPVADAVATGDCTTVLAALPTPATAEERLARGWCLERLGRAEDAAEILAELDGSDVFGAYGRWIRAEALVDAGRPAEAADALEGLSLPGEAGLRARLLRGRALVEADRSLDARPGLRELLDTEVGDEARYWLAIGGERRGDLQPAIATHQRVWADSVRGPWADRAASRLEALGAPVDDLSTREARALALDRIRFLSRANRNTEALALLEAVRAVDPGATEGLALARARFAGRDYPGAVEAFREALGTAETADGSAEDLFDYALATSRTGDYDTAAVIYARLEALHPGSRQADLASFKQGYLAYDRGDCARAVPLLRDHVQRRPDSRHLDEALWFAARCHWRTGDVDQALKGWDRILSERPRSSLAVGALYWKARAAGRRGETALEQEGLEEVIRRHPTSGYAWFASTRLGRTFPVRERVERPAWPATLADRDEVRRAEALLAAGFRSWAREELAPVARIVKGREESLAAAHAFVAVGDYRTGRTLAAPWCGPAWKEGDPVAQQACTPMPEATIVFSVAGRFELPRLVPFGIMVAESALQPDVTSHAGARGLMQLMPEVAAEIHPALYGERPFDPDNLFSAPYNASLGTAELGSKGRSLDQTLGITSVPAAIAAYNGGEDAVRRWLASFEQRPDFDEFAEEIGYTETRQYVKRVLGYVMEYRWVYGDP